MSKRDSQPGQQFLRNAQGGTETKRGGGYWATDKAFGDKRDGEKTRSVKNDPKRKTAFLKVKLKKDRAEKCGQKTVRMENGIIRGGPNGAEKRNTRRKLTYKSRNAPKN